MVLSAFDPSQAIDPSFGQDRDALRGISLAELMGREFPPRREVVEGLLMEGVTILAGKPKTGKSWLTLDIALAVATGGLALGKLPVAQSDVLLLSLEDGQARLKERFRGLLRDRAIPDNLSIFTEWKPIDLGGAENLDVYLATHPGIGLVIIDTIAKIRPERRRGGDLYAEDYRVGSTFKPVAEKNGAAIILVHHTRKMGAEDANDEISGTTGLTGGVDNTLVLRRQGGQGGQRRATLSVDGRDICESGERALTWDTEATRWVIEGDAAAYRMSDERQEIIDLLRSAGDPLRPKGIAVRLMKNESTTRQMLRKMKGDGQLVTDGKGNYSAVPVNGVNGVNAVTIMTVGIDQAAQGAFTTPPLPMNADIPDGDGQECRSVHAVHVVHDGNKVLRPPVMMRYRDRSSTGG